MAYTRRKSARAPRRAVSRRAAPRRSYRASGTSRRTTARRSGGASRSNAVRIVIVHENANPIARPALGLMQAAKPRLPAFG